MTEDERAWHAAQKKVRCPALECSMVTAFALARSRSGGDANAVHAAKASGSRWVVLPKKGILRLAVPRNAMRILAVFAKQIIGMVSCRMLVVLPSKSAKHMAAAPQKRFPGYTT